jgi:phage terminase large subunit GpA-like protein
MLSRYRISNIDKPNSRAHGMQFVLVDGDQYKTMIATRLRRPNGRGSWMVYKGCDEEYAHQLTTEQRVPVKKGGRDVWIWKKKTEHAQNHYLDAEVYAAAAAELMQIRYLDPGDGDQGPGAGVPEGDGTDRTDGTYVGAPGVSGVSGKGFPETTSPATSPQPSPKVGGSSWLPGGKWL